MPFVILKHDKVRGGHDHEKQKKSHTTVGHPLFHMSVAPITPALARDLALLAGDPADPGFGRHLLSAVRHAARLSNVAAFQMGMEESAVPVLMLAEGDLGHYRLRRNARDAAATVRYRDQFTALLRPDSRHGTRPTAAFSIDTPGPDDPRAAIYRRSGLIQRVTAVQPAGRAVHILTFYRAAADGLLGAAEITRLRHLVPVLLALVVLRNQLTGSTIESVMPRAGHVTAARDRGHPLFGKLSQREAEVCDLIVAGLTTAGIAVSIGVAENSVRTFRARAYRKMGITTLSQLFALVLEAEAG